IESLIGFFVNTLVLRTNFVDNPSFGNLLAQVRDNTLQAYEHQDVPFEQVVEALQPQRSLSHSPLFQVMLAWENAPLSKLELPGVTCCELAQESKIAKFDLTLTMRETDQRLVGEWEYNTDLFDGSTIERMAVHFQNLLMGIVENPQQAVGEIPMLNTEERHQLLVEWNDTVRAYPREKCIHQLFESQVERTPNAVAVVWENQQLTYRELNQRANQLANYLKSLGVKPELLVGICIERSLEMIVGLLGILKAGGAYVPLDPHYPPERLAQMLNDSQASILLTQKKLRQKLSDYTGLLIDLDSQWQVISQDGEQNIVSDVEADNLAYVIYTSGSTGKPKGVMISHRSLVNAYWGWEEAYQLSTHTSSHLQMASFSFDVFTGDMVRALCSGGKLVLCPKELLLMPEQLYELMQTEKVDCGEFVPVVIRNLIGYLEKTGQNLELLKVLVVGSDSWYVQEYQQLQKLCQQNTRIINSYGTSETTIDSCYFESSAINLASDVLVPIGRPLSNIKIYILDGNLAPVAIGVHGELYIGGAGVARGYLNLPELTQAKFIPNPFSDQPSERLYKTGDLTRYLIDGNIEYLGRIDNQVKIRGFRIELGEVEAVLTQHPAIRETVVIARENIALDKQLVAYVVPHQEPAPTNSDLRHFLKAQLPDYMMPSAFVVLEALPLTPNGKVDRRALPQPELRPELEPTFVAPQTPTEELVASIWEKVLRVSQVGINDNFFELGGHSLQAISLVSKLSVEMNLKVSVELLFSYPTIAELAQVLWKLSTQNTSFTPEKPQAKIEETMTASFTKTTDISPFFQLEQRSLLSLFAVGKIAPIDSAALGYLFLSPLKGTSVTRNEILQNWFDNLPMWDTVMETKWGRIAGLTLPIFEDELYSDPQKLVQMTVEALEMAGRLGAKTVSLTGLIPSATDYGRAILKAVEGRTDLPKITTGHATTCSAVVLTIKKILLFSNRSLEQEKVAFIGLGSIGLNTLRLMLKCLPHPSNIILCDVYSKLESIQNIQRELISDLGFRGSIQIATSTLELPPEIYDATLIIGATNVPDILDIERVKPGTLIVDDSGPHCFSPEQAIKRFEKQKDILFTEGGVLLAPHPIETVIHLPEWIKNNLNEALWKEYVPTNSQHIMGCVLSSLLSTRFDYMEPTVGLLNLETCVQHYQGLEQLGFQSADLHCEGYVLPVEPK
ncbi:MAG: hypothetical protein AN485_15395, partial [Anabaena sp. MDT14b]